MDHPKSLLLGASTALVALFSAQAAELPTMRSAPTQENAKTCTIDGMAGFRVAGSNMCVRISGYVSGGVEAGNSRGPSGPTPSKP